MIFEEAPAEALAPPTDEEVVFSEATVEDISTEEKVRSEVASTAAPTRLEPLPDSAAEEFAPAPVLQAAAAVPPVAEPAAQVAATAPPAPPEKATSGRSRRTSAVKPPRSGVRKSSGAAALVDPALTVQRPDDTPPASWPQRVVQWCLSLAAMGYGVSLLMHLMLITGLSVVVLAPKLMEGPIGLDAGGEIGGVGTVGDLEGLSLDPGGSGFEQPSTAVDVEMAQGMLGLGASSDELSADALQSGLMGNKGAGGGDGGGSGQGEGDGVGNGKGLPFAMPGAGGRVTKKGSFTAWTIPEDPKPEEDYKIVIQIQLPPGISRLPRRDLDGSIVEGTDGYRLHIPRPIVGYLPGNATQAQLVVPVPGARSLVRDRITLKSRVLKEQQVLEIEF